ncbi:tetratricopeptide repeat protein [Adhaeribacter sp. BT258]|uniref:Tetratricopeptide repeat protein n=1 Tax=Adhaeribacter terrigena TaxID=2793070 RepID=A0ABS1BX17_9BACT|nr:tetratricopeptide repeat protein [Adhaeribacter terrigena]MBK0401594.1 tetratricopeptide repeat protein [Adhaeribacter terrigena]
MFRIRIFLFAFSLLFTAAGTPVFAQQSETKKERKERKRQEKLEKRNRKKKKTALVIPAEIDAKARQASESFFLDGVKYAMLEDYPQALESFMQAYKLNPENAAVNFKVAEMYLNIRKENEALPYAKAALDLDPENSYYYLLLGQLYAGRQQFAEATNVFTRLLEKFPQEEMYYFNLADLYLAQNKTEDAVRIYERAEKQFGELEQIIFRKQQLYLKQNQLEKALAEGQKLIDNNPTEPQFVMAQAQILGSNNRPDEGIALLNRLLRSDVPDDPQVHLLLSDLYRQKNQPQAAEEQLKIAFGNPLLSIDDKIGILVRYMQQLPNKELEPTATQLAQLTVKAHPTEAKAYAVSGDIQALSGNKKAARDFYAKSLKYDKSHFQVWQQLIVLDAELGENDSLLMHTEKATDLFPNQAVVWFYNGTAHLIKKNFSKAAKALEFGKKLSADVPELQTQFNLQLGDAYNSMKQYEKSNNAYEAVLAIDPNNIHVLNNYSYFLSVRNQDLPKAKEMAEKLIKMAPEESTYLDTYAWVLYKMKDYTSAKTYLEKALETSKDGTVIEHYGDVLFQLGKKDEALSQWQQAKKAGGASDLIDKKIRDKKLYE